MPVIGIYIRMTTGEIRRFCNDPEILPKYDPRVALADGRGLDLGRAWEELGVFLDGGVRLPETGPTIGEIPLPNTDSRATWSYIAPERVAAIATELGAVGRRDFMDRYHEPDPEETADSLPGSRTGGWGDRGSYLYKKLRALAAHFARAAESGEAMLVRIGTRI
jgi:hypothetical protein